MHKHALFPCRLAAVDIDDTLVGPDKQIGEANRAAVQRLRGLGCRVVLASGRRHENILPFHRELGLDDFLAPYHPVSSTFAGGRLTARLSGSRRDAARVLGALADRYRVAAFEVESASLEDAVLEIVRRSREDAT